MKVKVESLYEAALIELELAKERLESGDAAGHFRHLVAAVRYQMSAASAILEAIAS